MPSCVCVRVCVRRPRRAGGSLPPTLNVTVIENAFAFPSRQLEENMRQLLTGGAMAQLQVGRMP